MNPAYNMSDEDEEVEDYSYEKHGVVVSIYYHQRGNHYVCNNVYFVKSILLCIRKMSDVSFVSDNNRAQTHCLTQGWAR